MPQKAIKCVNTSSCCNVDIDEEIYYTRGLAPQSGESSFVEESQDLNSTKQITTEFMDSENQPDPVESVLGKWYKPTKTANSDIVDFLKRPVLIRSFDWAVGGLVNQAFTPWDDYFSATAINKKLDNYAFLRCDLKIKVLINASPFYYGALLVSYQPEAGMARDIVNTSSDEIVGYSQMPHIWCYPQTNTGGEMTLPFLSTTEWIHTVGTGGITALQNMGTLRFDSIGTLIFANTTGAADINVQVYAWAENVELAGLTTDVALQSGVDEYGQGPVSKIASAIARGASKLESAPVIGSYMTSTRMAANSISSIASLFGYTKVPNIANIEPVKNLPFHGLATSDQCDVTEKLTVDSKNELCIDSSVIGGSKEDDLLISNFVQRSSYLTTFTWQASDAEGTLLWNSYVVPAMGTLTAGTSQNYWQGTPMWIMNEMFQYWRGDIIFDVKVVASGYHRGRMICAWDPSGDIANTINSTSTCFNKIVDISEETEFSLRIPYIQATPYQKTPDSIEEYFDITALPSDPYGGTTNGILTFRVLNKQTSPVASANVKILISVRGAENLEFAAPKKINTDINFYAVQSGETVMGEPSTLDPNVNLVYMGEKVSSVRELLQRANYNQIITTSTNIANAEFKGVNINRRPLYRGFDPNGIHVATGPVSAGSEPFNFVPNTPYQMITSCFLGERGSITWKVDANIITKSSLSVTRSQDLLTVARYNSGNAANVISAASGASTFNADTSEDYATCAGMALINLETNTGMSANAPMYSIYTMLDTDPDTRTLGNTVVATTTDTLQLRWSQLEDNSVGTRNQIIKCLFQTGPDHSLVQFLCVPTIYLYSSPTPV